LQEIKRMFNFKCVRFVIKMINLDNYVQLVEKIEVLVTLDNIKSL
jgi:hypothetical protein